MHITGLIGMPRRVYTYPVGMGWDALNLVSTIGAFMIAAGVALFLFDLARNFRFASEDNAGNVWNAGTLEWLPNGNYATRSIPAVVSREPLWDQPNLSKDVEEGRYYLPGTATGGREALVTSPIDARPQYILQIPGAGLAAVLAAVFTAAFFLLLTVKLVLPSVVCGVLAIGCVIWWLWETDPGPTRPPADIGGGIVLPVYVTGPMNHSWWAMIVLMVVSGMVFTCLVFSYLFLWLVNPSAWPLQGFTLPHWIWPAARRGALCRERCPDRPRKRQAAGRGSPQPALRAGSHRRCPRAGVGGVRRRSRGAVAGGLKPLGPCLWRRRLRHRVVPDLLRAHDADHGPLYDRPLARRQARQRAPDDLR